MIKIPYSDKCLGNNTWWFYWISGDRKVVVARCSNGHIGGLDDHEIAEDGTVSPSVVCQAEGCDFHEFIQLDEWAERTKIT